MVDDTITVNGIPLSKYLGEQEAEEKKAEVVEEIKETITKWRKTLSRRKTISSKPIYQSHSRVRKWTDQEIRERMGVMVKPHDTQIMNILEFIKGTGPVTIAEIHEKLGGSLPGIATTVRRLTARIPGIVETMGPEKPFHFRFKEDRWSAEEAHKEYLAAGKYKPGDEGRPLGKGPAGEHLFRIYSHPPGQNIIPKEITVKVEVSGTVLVLFGLKE